MTARGFGSSRVNLIWRRLVASAVSSCFDARVVIAVTGMTRNDQTYCPEAIDVCLGRGGKLAGLFSSFLPLFFLDCRNKARYMQNTCCARWLRLASERAFANGPYVYSLVHAYTVYIGGTYA